MLKSSLPRLLLFTFFASVHLITPTRVFAEDDEKHPIERKMDDCMESNTSMSGMQKCAITAIEQWEVELNRIYNALMGKLDKEGKEKLKTTQFLWLKYRDAEFETINSVYTTAEREMGGDTLWKLTPLIAKADIVKNRTLELTRYLNDFRPEEN